MLARELYHGRQSWYVTAANAVTVALTDVAGTARVNADLCVLSDESQRSSVIAYTIALYVVALSLVALRVLGKIVSTGLAWNDAPIVAAVLLAAIPIACVLSSKLNRTQSLTHADHMVIVAKIGFGEHLWNLEDGAFLPILRYCKFMPMHNLCKVLTQ